MDGLLKTIGTRFAIGAQSDELHPVTGNPKSMGTLVGEPNFRVARYRDIVNAPTCLTADMVVRGQFGVETRLHAAGFQLAHVP